MDRYPQMLYRIPGPLVLENGSFDTLVVDGDEALEAALAAGWHETSPEAKDAHEKAQAALVAEKAKAAAAESTATDSDAGAEKVSEEPMTRAELEQAATELGLKFDGRTTDKKLAALVAEKLKG